MILTGKPAVPIEEVVPVSIFHSKFQTKWPEIGPMPSQGKVGDCSTDPWRSLESAVAVLCHVTIHA